MAPTAPFTGTPTRSGRARQDEPQDYEWLRRAKGNAVQGSKEGGMWARRRTGTGRPLKGSTRVPVTEADAKESLWKLRRSWERGSARGARVRGPLNGPTPPSRERRSTHKTNSVGPTVADATERQEIGLAVRVQGFDPPGDVDTQLPYRGNFFGFLLLLAFVLPVLGCLLPRHGALVGFVSFAADHV